MSDKLSKTFEKHMDPLKIELAKSIKETCTDLYTEWLPFVEEDSSANFTIAIEQCLKKLLNADYELNENNYIYIDSPYGSISFSVPYGVSEALATRHKDIIKSKRIEDLESEVKHLTECLNRRY